MLLSSRHEMTSFFSYELPVLPHLKIDIRTNPMHMARGHNSIHTYAKHQASYSSLCTLTSIQLCDSMYTWLYIERKTQR